MELRHEDLNGNKSGRFLGFSVAPLRLIQKTHSFTDLKPVKFGIDFLMDILGLKLLMDQTFRAMFFLSKNRVHLIFISLLYVTTACGGHAQEETENAQNRFGRGKFQDGQKEEFIKEPFQEGILYMKVSFPGNPMAQAFSKLDFDEDIAPQMEAMYAKMSASEQAALSRTGESMGLMSLVIMMTPFQSTLQYRKGEVLAKAEGYGYHLENYQNSIENKGIYYVASRTGENTVTMRYAPSTTGKTWQSMEVYHRDFDISTLDEPEIVAGYSCQGKRYMAKSDRPSDLKMGQAVPQLSKLEVYTSKQMASDINFQHPIYIPEENGILKIIAYFGEGDRATTMVYEATRVQAKVLEDKDMVIRTSTPIYDMDDDKDLLEGGFKLMGIMMGSGAEGNK